MAFVKKTGVEAIKAFGWFVFDNSSNIIITAEFKPEIEADANKDSRDDEEKSIN